jgi:hypothetical protein
MKQTILGILGPGFVHLELTLLFWQEEKWETEEGSQTYILSSSMQVKGNCMVVNSLVFSRLASVG